MSDAGLYVIDVTPEEEDTLKALGDAARAFNRLPEQHPSETREWELSIHRLQDLVVSRSVYRAHGDAWSEEEIEDGKRKTSDTGK